MRKQQYSTEEEDGSSQNGVGNAGYTKGSSPYSNNGSGASSFDYLNDPEDTIPYRPSAFRENKFDNGSSRRRPSPVSERFPEATVHEFEDDLQMRETVQPKLIWEANFFERMLLHWTGANLQILESCPTEKYMFLDAAYGIMASMGLALMAGSFFANNMLRVPMPTALFGGLFQAAVVGTMDTLLVRGMHPPRVKNAFFRFFVVLMMILPRFAASLAIGYLINTPLEAYLFRGEINASIALKQKASEQLVEKKLAATPLGQEIDDLKTRLKAELAKADAGQTELRNAEQGIIGGTVDDQQNKQQYLSDVRIRLADTQKYVALKEAAIKDKLATKEAEMSVERNAQYTTVKESAGPLLVQETMHDLVFHGDTNGDGVRDVDNLPMLLIYGALFLAFTIIETMPVWVKAAKMLKPTRPYYDKLAAYETRSSETANYASEVMKERLKAEKKEEIAFQGKRIALEQKTRLNLVQAHLDVEEDRYRADSGLEPRRSTEGAFDSTEFTSDSTDTGDDEYNAALDNESDSEEPFTPSAQGTA